MAMVMSPGDVNRYVGLAIQVARQARRMSLEQLAACIGLSRDRLVAIEEGHEEASAVDLHLLARTLNLDVCAFFIGLDPRFAGSDGSPSRRRLAFPDLLNATIGARLRRLREINGLTPAALAVLSGLRSGRIQRIESGKVEAAASELFAIGRVLGVSVTFFFDGYQEGDEHPWLPDTGHFAPSTVAA